MSQNGGNEVRHFLIVFDRERQELVGRPRMFADSEEAAHAYSELERKLRSDRRFEIVLVSSDSLDTIKRTHGNYFGTPSVSPYLAGTR